MNTKKLSSLAFLCVVFSALFSLTLISFHADVSLAALPLSLVFTAFFAFVSMRKLFKDGELAFIFVLRELLQYLPYALLTAFVLRRAGEMGTPFALDLISVLLWLAASLLALIILHFMHPKRISKVSREWAAFCERRISERKKMRGSLAAAGLRELVSWIDALVQAVFMVLLLNIFIVQLYEIPSESMVPEFLIRDRVVVFKTLSGPKFPLSEVGLPCLKKYGRGDIVVFRNPHYDSDRKSELRAFLSQLVYMCTLTKVNINVDESGNQKADPLVKRVCGVGGEQLMMQDGVLYARTMDSPDFMPVEDDSVWAAWNLNDVSPSLRDGIRDIPLTERDYEDMLLIEEERRGLDLERTLSECREIAGKFSEEHERFRRGRAGASDSEPFFLSASQMTIYFFIANAGKITSSLLHKDNGAEWFAAFMTEWGGGIPDFGGDLYAEANFRLNLMIKVLVGKILLRHAELYNGGLKDGALPDSDSRISEYVAEGQRLYFYTAILDQRNMPVFPPCSEDGAARYIPRDCYFMMGDNRFNSLDMRHSYERWNERLTSADNYSMTYMSDMRPQFVSRDRMLGSTSFRFWPPSRLGVPGKNGGR